MLKSSIIKCFAMADRLNKVFDINDTEPSVLSDSEQLSYIILEVLDNREGGVLHSYYFNQNGDLYRVTRGAKPEEDDVPVHEYARMMASCPTKRLSNTALLNLFSRWLAANPTKLLTTTLDDLGDAWAWEEGTPTTLGYKRMIALHSDTLTLRWKAVVSDHYDYDEATSTYTHKLWSQKALLAFSPV